MTMPKAGVDKMIHLDEPTRLTDSPVVNMSMASEYVFYLYFKPEFSEKVAKSYIATNVKKDSNGKAAIDMSMVDAGILTVMINPTVSGPSTMSIVEAVKTRLGKIIKRSRR